MYPWDQDDLILHSKTNIYKTRKDMKAGISTLSKNNETIPSSKGSKANIDIYCCDCNFDFVEFGTVGQMSDISPPRLTENLTVIFFQVGLAGKITSIHEAVFRELSEAEKAFDEATINLEDPT